MYHHILCLVSNLLPQFLIWCLISGRHAVKNERLTFLIYFSAPRSGRLRLAPPEYSLSILSLTKALRISVILVANAVISHTLIRNDGMAFSSLMTRDVEQVNYHYWWDRVCLITPAESNISLIDKGFSSRSFNILMYPPLHAGTCR